jgi:transcriptional regulator with XRE-family HTH domain
MKFPEALKLLRTHQRVTQKRMAKVAGISYSLYRGIEEELHPITLRSLTGIISALDLPLEMQRHLLVMAGYSTSSQRKESAERLVSWMTSSGIPLERKKKAAETIASRLGGISL